jgi:hypothetical protein
MNFEETLKKSYDLDALSAIGERKILLNKLYSEVERSPSSRKKLVEYKFAFQHWNYFVGQKNKEDQNDEEFEILSIPPFQSSRWDFKKWRENSRIRSLSKGDTHLRYKNLVLQPGDLFLASPHLESAGLFTIFSEPESFSAHLAVYCHLNYQDKYFPALIEVYEKGVRAVPLDTFLAPHFSNHCEILRFNDVTNEHLEVINENALKTLSKGKGYSFNTDDRDEHYFTCTRLVKEIFSTLPINVEVKRSEFSCPKKTRNLHLIDFTFKDILEPCDFLDSNVTSYVGRVDNEEFLHDLLCYISVHQYVEIFKEYDLNPYLEKKSFRTINFCSNQIANQNVLGLIFSKVFGYSFDNFPRGPLKLLSYYYFTEPRIIKFSKQIKNELFSMIERDEYFNLFEFLESKEFIELCEKYSTTFKQLFSRNRLPHPSHSTR